MFGSVQQWVEEREVVDVIENVANNRDDGVVALHSAMVEAPDCLRKLIYVLWMLSKANRALKLTYQCVCLRPCLSKLQFFSMSASKPPTTFLTPSSGSRRFWTQVIAYKDMKTQTHLNSDALIKSRDAVAIWWEVDGKGQERKYDKSCWHCQQSLFPTSPAD